MIVVHLQELGNLLGTVSLLVVMMVMMMGSWRAQKKAKKLVQLMEVW